jgi:hypothetical protein
MSRQSLFVEITARAESLHILQIQFKQLMGVRWWRKQGEERAEWKKITEKAKKPTVGCNASKRRRIRTVFIVIQ